jgi:hypothetical protein
MIVVSHRDFLRGVRQLQTALGHHFSEVSKAELVAQVPTTAKDDSFAVDVASIKRFVDVFQLTHWLVLIKSPSVTDRRIRIAPQPAKQASLR